MSLWEKHANKNYKEEVIWFDLKMESFAGSILWDLSLRLLNNNQLFLKFWCLLNLDSQRSVNTPCVNGVFHRDIVAESCWLHSKGSCLDSHGFMSHHYSSFSAIAVLIYRCSCYKIDVNIGTEKCRISQKGLDDCTKSAAVRLRPFLIHIDNSWFWYAH